MIGVGKHYRVSFVKSGVAKNGNNWCRFSIADSVKENGKYVVNGYANVLCSLDTPPEEKSNVIIDKITGIALGEYNGKQQVTIFAEVTPEDTNQMFTDVDPSELPF